MLVTAFLQPVISTSNGVTPWHRSDSQYLFLPLMLTSSLTKLSQQALLLSSLTKLSHQAPLPSSLTKLSYKHSYHARFEALLPSSLTSSFTKLAFKLSYQDLLQSSLNKLSYQAFLHMELSSSRWKTWGIFEGPSLGFGLVVAVFLCQRVHNSVHKSWVRLFFRIWITCIFEKLLLYVDFV